MFFTIHLAASVVFYIYTFVLFERIYISKRHNPFIQLLFLFTAAFFMTALKNLEIPIFNLTYSFLSLILLNVIFYKPTGKSFLIYDAIILMVMMITEMLTTFLLAYIIDVPTDEILKQPYTYAATAVLGWIVMLAVAKGFIAMCSKDRTNHVRMQEVIMFFVLITGEIVLLSFLNDVIVVSKTKYEIVLILLIFLLIDLYLTYLIQRISTAYKTEKELELLTQQSTIQLNAYKQLNEKYTSSRRIIHDVRKHIASLEGLINANKADEAVRYRDLLNTELNKLMPRFECDSSILTVVINNKLEAADTMEVDFRVDAEFTQIDFISNLDITAIFSNLLDNAFEACSELPADKRHVWLSITRHNYFVFIYVENNFSRVSPDNDKFFRSTKKNHQGIGLSNIRSACEKYHGSFNAHTENDMFITELLIPIPANAPDSEPGGQELPAIEQIMGTSKNLFG